MKNNIEKLSFEEKRIKRLDVFLSSCSREEQLDIEAQAQELAKKNFGKGWKYGIRVCRYDILDEITKKQN